MNDHSDATATSRTDAQPDGYQLGQPLSGLRIIDTTTFVAGPSATVILSQLGADVIRVDPLAGASDLNRLPVAESGRSLYWASLNKGKRSVAIDSSTKEGRALLIDLITAPGAGGGIYVTNAVGRSLLDYHMLADRRPDLIMIHIQGRADGSPAIDYTVTRDLGVHFRVGPDGENRRVEMPLPIWDSMCGMYAALAVVTAERQRRMTGRGQLVQVALWDVALSALGNWGQLAETQASVSPKRITDGFVYGTFGRDFLARDGTSVLVVALTPRMWADLVRVTDTGTEIVAVEQALGVNFADEEARYEHREIIADMMRGWFSARDGAEIGIALTETRIVWSLGRSIESLVQELVLNPPPIVDFVTEPDVGEILVSNSPLRFSGSASKEPSPSPILGQNSLEVLTEVLGMDRTEARTLMDRGLIYDQSTDG